MLSKILIAAVIAGTPLLYGTLGEILTEKSGSLNLGVEGEMFMGSIAGIVGAWAFENAGGSPGNQAILVALVCSFIAGAFGGLIYSFLTVSLHTNQNVTGLTLAMFGTGFANFFGDYFGGKSGGVLQVSEITKASLPNLDLGFLTDIPFFGKLLFNYNWLVYLSFITAIFLAIFLYRTRQGLALTSVGQDPSTADSAGINVAKNRYLAAIIGGGICGIGGMYISMATNRGVWVYNCVSGQGWLAVALVIFSSWNPIKAIFASIIFGGLSILRFYLPIQGLASQIYAMLPYIVTILVLILNSVSRKKNRDQPQASGLDYFREDR